MKQEHQQEQQPNKRQQNERVGKIALVTICLKKNLISGLVDKGRQPVSPFEVAKEKGENNERKRDFFHGEMVLA